jgi:hypothetical protein
VVDRRNGSIEVFDLSGNHQKTLNHPALTAPVGIAYDATRDLLWISDVNSHQLLHAQRHESTRANIRPARHAARRVQLPHRTRLASDHRLGHR